MDEKENKKRRGKTKLTFFTQGSLTGRPAESLSDRLLHCVERFLVHLNFMLVEFTNKGIAVATQRGGGVTTYFCGKSIILEDIGTCLFGTKRPDTAGS